MHRRDARRPEGRGEVGTHGGGGDDDPVHQVALQHGDGLGRIGVVAQVHQQRAQPALLQRAGVALEHLQQDGVVEVRRHQTDQLRPPRAQRGRDGRRAVAQRFGRVHHARAHRGADRGALREGPAHRRAGHTGPVGHVPKCHRHAPSPSRLVRLQRLHPCCNRLHTPRRIASSMRLFGHGWRVRPTGLRGMRVLQRRFRRGTVCADGGCTGGARGVHTVFRRIERVVGRLMA